MIPNINPMTTVHVPSRLGPLRISTRTTTRGATLKYTSHGTSTHGPAIQAAAERTKTIPASHCMLSGLEPCIAILVKLITNSIFKQTYHKVTQGQGRVIVIMKAQGPLLDDDTITPKQLADIIRNHDVRCQLLGKEYLLLIKEEANHRCLLLASDCEQAIWSRPLDIPFFMALRKEMHLTTTIQILADHFVRSLEQRATLERVRTQLRVTLQMRIGEGIMMASSITIDSRVHFNNPDDFKPALRRFILYMWEVKSAQLRGQMEKEEQEKKALELKEKLEKEEDKSKSLFATDSKAKRISLKHRDLVNPQRKKRKKNGAKLGLGYEQRTPFELPQDFDL